MGDAAFAALPGALRPVSRMERAAVAAQQQELFHVLRQRRDDEALAAAAALAVKKEAEAHVAVGMPSQEGRKEERPHKKPKLEM